MPQRSKYPKFLRVLFLSALVVALTGAVAGCASVPGDDPQAVAEVAVERVYERDYEGLYEMASNTLQSAVSPEEAWLEGAETRITERFEVPEGEVEVLDSSEDTGFAGAPDEDTPTWQMEVEEPDGELRGWRVNLIRDRDTEEFRVCGISADGFAGVSAQRHSWILGDSC